MRKRLIAAITVATAGVVALQAPVDALVSTVYTQDFSGDTAGWMDSDDAWFGTVTHNLAAGTATMTDDDTSGPFSRFDGYRSEWPGNWIAEIDVYLDPAWAVGTGFDYSVAAGTPEGGHRRDFVIHVERDTQGLWFGGSNNSSSAPRGRAGLATFDIPAAGWYTLQHTFANVGGVLQVTMSLLDAGGETLFSAVRSETTDVIGQTVGGNRYSWFTYINVASGVEVDNHQLSIVLPSPGVKDDCKDGGFAAFGYENQGQCVASISAATNS